MIKEIKRQYLEIKSLQSLVPVKRPNNNCKVIMVENPDFHLNLFFYKQIGKKHRWIDRLEWTDEQWMKYINNPNVYTYILKDGEEMAGYFELIKEKNKKDTEIAYFGVLEDFHGKKYGGYLLSEAIKFSLTNGSEKVWVHTCSLDHKNALPNYQARGMEIFKSEIARISF